MPPRPVVKEWTVDDLAALVSEEHHDYDFEQGKQLFAAAQCYKCHRMGLQGGILGPDLTGAGGRFTPRDLLVAIIEPSKEIRDQYGSTQFLTEDGEVIVGRVINMNNNTLSIMTNMLDPSQLTDVNRDRIEATRPATTRTDYDLGDCQGCFLSRVRPPVPPADVSTWFWQNYTKNGMVLPGGQVLANTYRRRLWDEALSQYGYVTTADAARLGVPVVELAKLAGRGALEKVTRGLYRFPDVPRTPRGPFMEAVLWAGPDAVLSHDAVLALHELAFANPRTIRVTTPHRVRKVHPRADITVIRADIPAVDRTHYFGIPSVTVARALVDCRQMIMPSRLRDAAAEAHRLGLLLGDEHQRVIEKLGEAS
jgi:putative heme-binding domain-containing protein